VETGVTILPGSASTRLGAAVCALLDLAPASCHTQRFPDGELQVELAESVRGDDVFLIQDVLLTVVDELMMLAQKKGITLAHDMAKEPLLEAPQFCGFRWRVRFQDQRYPQ